MRALIRNFRLLVVLTLNQMRFDPAQTAPRRLRLLVPLLLSALALALPATATAKVPDDFFGVSATLPMEGDYARMGKVGFGAYRFDINWAGVQKRRKSPYDWSGPDATVRQAVQAGMRPIPILIGTPRFVKRGADGLYPPTNSRANMQAWQAFVAAATARYGRGGNFWDENAYLEPLPIHEWLIWNEQNALAFWEPKPNPRDYATLVRISDEAISGVDPKAEIVLGGMFGYPRNEDSFSAVSFLRRFYRTRGIEKHFETVTIHPYGAGVGTVRRQLKQARTAVRKAGDKNANLLVGEIGWASSGPREAEEVVGAQGQAERLRKGLSLLVSRRRAWNISGAIVYIWRDFPPQFTACPWCPNAGLVEEDGTNKPALNAVRRILRRNR